MSRAASQVNVPNVLTGLRILAVPLFGWMLLAHAHDGGWRQATTLLFGVAILTDLVDGWWARRFDVVTDFGKIADPIADKALTGMAFVGLSIIGELTWVATVLILVREWGITLLRFLLLRRGVVLAASRGGKLKTLTQTVALALFLWPFTAYAWGRPITSEVIPDLVSWVVMALAVAITLVTGADYLRAAFDDTPARGDD